ncbi:MAG TPA: hypothetical protein VIW07_02705 [Candidatus Udaeobacter sp.]|jgi:hypothetical protein
MIVILSKAKDLTNYSARLTALVQDHAGKVDEENSEVPSIDVRSLAALGMTESEAKDLTELK